MRHGSLKLKAQFLCGESIALGPGKVDLLDAIAATGSISAAGRQLGMSYRRAWLLVDEMNRCFNSPLVATRGARGAVVTTLGERARHAYRDLEAKLDRSIEADAAFALLSRSLRPAPLPNQPRDTP